MKRNLIFTQFKRICILELKRRLPFKPKGCFRCRNTHDRSAKCPDKNSKCKHCGKGGHCSKVCMQQHLQKVHQIEDKKESEEETSNTEPITVFLETLTSTKHQQTQEISLNILDSNTDNIYAKVKIYKVHDMSLKVDMGVDVCVIHYHHRPTALPIPDYYSSMKHIS